MIDLYMCKYEKLKQTKTVGKRVEISCKGIVRR